ncbi:MAG: phage holin family protein [Actinomycetota bacterium]|nr:phage holin family protein [Actinomycetota bacterium]
MSESQSQAAGSTSQRPPQENASIGELLSEATREMSELMRKEVQLAKVELREEVSQASKAGGKLGAAAFIGYLALLLASFAIAWGLTALVAVGWAFLIVAVIFAIVAAVLFSNGRKQLRAIKPMTQTMQTLKEDAKWAKAQTK